jgi:hypothetical protein
MLGILTHILYSLPLSTTTSTALAPSFPFKSYPQTWFLGTKSPSSSNPFSSRSSSSAVKDDPGCLEVKLGGTPWYASDGIEVVQVGPPTSSLLGRAWSLRADFDLDEPVSRFFQHNALWRGISLLNRHRHCGRRRRWRWR